MLLPALAKAKDRAKAASCLNNFKQLTLCWTMYAGDNNEQLISNWTDGEKAAPCAWVVGDAWKDSYVLQTNNIRSGLLFQYNTSLGIYKCPADTAHILGSQVSRVRSVAISAAMNWANSGPTCDPSLQSQIVIWKSSQIISPGPSGASVFWDEKAVDSTDTTLSSPNSIDNGTLGIYPLGSGQIGYWNVPASRHNNGGMVSFADGHVEIWHWRDPYIATATRFQTSVASDRDGPRAQSRYGGRTRGHSAPRGVTAR